MKQSTRWFLFLCFLLSSAAQAGNYCVTNGSQLNAALIIAASNGQHDLIKLATGIYTFPGGSGTFTYHPTYTSGEWFDLEISGGWTALGNDPCGQAPDASSPYATVLYGSGALIMEIYVENGTSNPDFTVRRVSFVGNGEYTVADANALRIISPGSGYSGTVRVDQCAFLDNLGSNPSLKVHSSSNGDSTFRLSNSLFDGNFSESGGAAVLFITSARGVYVTNNTFVYNTSGTSHAGLFVSVSTVVPALVANNNLWFNNGSDLNLKGDNVILRHNNIRSRTGDSPIEDTNNISVLPEFESGNLNYTPVAGSPLRDAGTQPPLIGPTPRPFADNWSTGVRDVRARNRIQGQRIDIGAFEATPNAVFLNSFE